MDTTYAISSKIYDLIYELNVICPRILLAVLPQLECKLKSGQESERLSKSHFSNLIFTELSPRCDMNQESLMSYAGML